MLMPCSCGCAGLKPQTAAVLHSLRAAGSYGRTRVDFARDVPSVLNVAGRVYELRAAGWPIVSAGRRHGCKVYRLAGRGPIVTSAQKTSRSSTSTPASSRPGVVGR